jgi:hypothetical protein
MIVLAVLGFEVAGVDLRDALELRSRPRPKRSGQNRHCSSRMMSRNRMWRIRK